MTPAALEVHNNVRWDEPDMGGSSEIRKRLAKFSFAILTQPRRTYPDCFPSLAVTLRQSS